MENDENLAELIGARAKTLPIFNVLRTIRVANSPQYGNSPKNTQNRRSLPVLSEIPMESFGQLNSSRSHTALVRTCERGPSNGRWIGYMC